MTIRALNVAIAAGGRVEGSLSASMETPIKALASVGERTMLERTITAAADLGARRIVVLGSSEVAANCDGRVARILPDAGNGAVNILACLRAFSDEKDATPTLVLSSDLPYIDAEKLADFLRRAPEDAVSMPLCSGDAYQLRFPGAPINGVLLSGERIVNGGALLIPQRAIERVAASASAFFEARKSPLRMAMLAGAPMLLAHLFKRVTIEGIERRASAILQFKSCAVRDCAPELCFDVDGIEEYRYALQAN